MNIKHAITLEKGFTLIELLLVTLMLSLVLESVYSLYRVHNRSSYVQDEVVDVQQNLRVAMDSISRDLRHAGFLFSSDSDFGVPITNASPEADRARFPTREFIDNRVNSATLPVTNDVSPALSARVHADVLTLNLSTPATTFATIASKLTLTTLPVTFTVETSESLDAFSAHATDGDYVRIMDPSGRDETTKVRSRASSFPCDQGTTFMVVAKSRTAKTITLQRMPAGNGCTPYNVDFARGSNIIKVPSIGLDTFPIPVTYCLGPTVGCAQGNGNCVRRNDRDNTFCLYRIENNTPQVVASRMSGFQLTYLMSDDKEVPNPITPLSSIDMRKVRAVRVTLTGQTANTALLSDDPNAPEKVRVLSTIVKLQNRNKKNL